MRNEKMKYRHEQKYIADINKIATLFSRLNATMQKDTHSANGYHIRSLYFDDLFNSAFHDKEAGVYVREKFRIRIYDGKLDDFFLEKKMKVGNLSNKTRTKLSHKVLKQIILDDDLHNQFKADRLLNEFLYKKKTQWLRPSQMVDYYRHAYVCSAGNVRITIDQHLSAPLTLDMLDFDGVSMPAMDDGLSIIEVKYDELFPDYLAQIIQMDFGRPQACSKYHLCRLAKNKILGV